MKKTSSAHHQRAIDVIADFKELQRRVKILEIKLAIDQKKRGVKNVHLGSSINDSNLRRHLLSDSLLQGRS